MAATRNHKRKRRRRGRFGFLYKLLSVVLIAAALLAGKRGLLPRGRGGSHRKSTVYRGRSDCRFGHREGDNLFLLKRQQIASQIRRQLPYVDEVSVRLHLPGYCHHHGE